VRCNRSPSLFDRFVNASEEGRRWSKAESFSGFQIDNEFVLVWCLHRQVGGLLTFKDLVNIAGRAPELTA